MSRLLLRRLGDFVDPVSKWNPTFQAANNTFTYIDISAVDQKTKTIGSPQTLQVADAPSRARQIVRSQDALVSTVRPNLNAVASVPNELNGAIASTGFTVLRPTAGKLHHRYLHHLTRSNDFINYLVSQATGASYPAVSDRIVKDTLVYIPPIGEQCRIAAILDRADTIRRKRQRALSLADDFLRSSFLDIFGHPVTNAKNWPWSNLGSLGKLERGRSMHRPRNAPELLGGSHPLIQTGDVAASLGGVISEYRQSYSDIGLNQSRKWPKGTLCITIAANIADSAVLGFDACFPDSVVGFTASPETIAYVQYLMNFLKPIIEEKAPQVAQKNINLEILKALPIPHPDQSSKNQFLTIMCKYREIYYKLRKLNADELFTSLSQRAFRGEL